MFEVNNKNTRTTSMVNPYGIFREQYQWKQDGFFSAYVY